VTTRVMQFAIGALHPLLKVWRRDCPTVLK